MDIQYIKRLIKAYGLTVTELAEKMKQSSSILYRKLDGTAQFTPEDVITLVNIFEKPIESFFLSDRLYYQGD